MAPLTTKASNGHNQDRTPVLKTVKSSTDNRPQVIPKYFKAFCDSFKIPIPTAIGMITLILVATLAADTPLSWVVLAINRNPR
ncbi:MAG: hypothetical protein Salg2KO_05400 [Salibacteraceae bacterium]